MHDQSTRDNQRGTVQESNPWGWCMSGIKKNIFPAACVANSQGTVHKYRSISTIIGDGPRVQSGITACFKAPLGTVHESNHQEKSTYNIHTARWPSWSKPCIWETLTLLMCAVNSVVSKTIQNSLVPY